ncbi:galactose-1-phosphate uridylyltransferase [bacterium]|jgi:UDPglucose--hexose-1-phosphate uridylyltransferase|nr:galactose-1-phosphate uridylyltransferase [bacterium]
MSEIRKDPIVNRWIIIATDRKNRPNDFSVYEENEDLKYCPFCEGNEKMTTPEITAVRKPDSAPNSAGWDLRVIPNKFPALRVENELKKSKTGIYESLSATGAHELIIESPDHNKDLRQFSEEKIYSILTNIKNRISDLRNDIRLQHIIVFKNVGPKAGATLKHPHFQLIAMPVIPKRAMEALTGARDYFKVHKKCVFCDIIRQETEIGDRIVDSNNEFLSFCPYASRFPFETWIIPKNHASDFDRAEEEHLMYLSRIMKNTLNKLHKALRDFQYNLLIHTSPLQSGSSESFHWHIEIFPRIVKTAGFEWGTGFFINSTPPEEAAKFLREI